MIKNISPKSEPLKEGESFWVISPNDGQLELDFPNGSYCICTKSWEDFEKDVIYPIVGSSTDIGYISLLAKSTIVYNMPHYVFARYFDINAFVKYREHQPSIVKTVNSPFTSFID